jgi:hypothetical protein
MTRRNFQPDGPPGPRPDSTMISADDIVRHVQDAVSAAILKVDQHYTDILIHILRSLPDNQVQIDDQEWITDISGYTLIKQRLEAQCCDLLFLRRPETAGLPSPRP